MGDLEDAFEAREALLEEELAVGDEAGVVVDEAEEGSAAVLAGALGVGEIGTDEHVALPGAPWAALADGRSKRRKAFDEPVSLSRVTPRC